MALKLFNFFKNKKTPKLEQTVSCNPQVMSEEDIALLAIMCCVCAPVVVKRGMINQVYAYYVPQSTKDLMVAKSLFAKNGIDMHVHYSHIIDSFGQDVLRINYANCANNEALEREMARINNKYISLYTPGENKEKAKLWKTIHELRQKQK